ncbi:hypothetical protein DFJ74DRAFT_665096 [Hyaloraphidium curvatum]|nr:hypothetical protein DFJ74DRAFT_665096 [Hyaloraphidium curvatum]
MGEPSNDELVRRYPPPPKPATLRAANPFRAPTSPAPSPEPPPSAEPSPSPPAAPLAGAAATPSTPALTALLSRLGISLDTLQHPQPPPKASEQSNPSPAAPNLSGSQAASSPAANLFPTLILSPNIGRGVPQPAPAPTVSSPSQSPPAAPATTSQTTPLAPGTVNVAIDASLLPALEQLLAEARARSAAGAPTASATPAVSQPASAPLSSSPPPPPQPSQAPQPPQRSPYDVENEHISSLNGYASRKSSEFGAMMPQPNPFDPPTSRNPALQRGIAFLEAEEREIRSFWEPRVAELERLRDGDRWFRAERLRRRMDEAAGECRRAADILRQMIADNLRAQANMAAIVAGANAYTTRTILEANRNRQHAFDVSNQRWSNVFNYGDEAPYVCQWCGGRFMRSGQPHVCR